MDNLIDTTTGTLKLRAMFANPDELLYPNQFVNARLLVNTMQNTVRVPVPAVQRGEPGTFVYLINANNTVSVRPIKVGPTDGDVPGGAVGAAAGRPGGDRRHRPVTRWRRGDAAGGADRAGRRGAGRPAQQAAGGQPAANRSGRRATPGCAVGPERAACGSIASRRSAMNGR